ncbi:MAG: calcium-translocating P-type ATPase, PMCA-type [Erysipelotrichales bacterium]|nr:calcium-translocating P-type ATPase, PMCA-type [Erysipelotrichales bacterium]
MTARYNQSLEEVIRTLQTNIEQGLTTEEAQRRLEEQGPNALEQAKKTPMFLRFLLQFKDALTIVLLLAAVISIVIDPHEWIDSLIIVIVVVLNAILGIVQESKAEKSLEALNQMSAPKATVIRDGKKTRIDSREIVVGDILLLEAGDSVASDARLIEVHNLKVDESALTGESVPVTKEVKELEEVPLGDRVNMVFASCNITYGRGVAVVTTTGMDNEVGKIATLLMSTKNELTPLQIKLDQIGKTIGILALVVCIIVFAMEVLSGLGILEAFKTAVALAVAAIPEGLATVVTIILALSVTKMVKQNAIVRKLPAVETLGSTSVVCSDKTGTLTQNKMTVIKVYHPDTGVVRLENSDDPEVIKMLNYFTLCSDGDIVVKDGKEEAIGDPTETALVKASLLKGYTKSDLYKEYARKEELAFDSDRKMMTVFYRYHDRLISITKGGLDVILARCDTIPNKEEILQANEHMANDALRVLAVAIREWESMPKLEPTIVEDHMTFIGMVGMIDPPRAEAKEAVSLAKRAGIRTIMITGDHKLTATAIAKDLGILEEGQLAMSGSELQNLSDEEFSEKIEQYSVYARVSPQDKVRIVKAWQSQGKVVAMTGDGVNDSPALKSADIGCAMGITGTEVAKGAAALILTDDNFATIIASIKEGRGIYDNIRKCVQFLLASNMGEVFTIFTASIVSLLTPLNLGVPLLPIHLLWVNLITDSLPAFALGTEEAESTVMERKPREKEESFFAGGLLSTIVWQGIMIGSLTLIAYIYGNSIDHNVGMTMAFLTLSTAQLVHAFNVKSHHSILNKSLFSNRYLWGAFLVGSLLQILLISVPVLSNIFKLVPLTVTQFAICILLSLSTVVICESVKRINRK